MVCRILVADDSSTIQKVIRIGLTSIPCELKSVGSLVEANKIAEPHSFDLIIADAGLPGVSTAVDFVKLSERAGKVPMILLMGSYDTVRETDLRAVGINHIIKKPFPPGELPQLVQDLVTPVSVSMAIPSPPPPPPPPLIDDLPLPPVQFSLDEIPKAAEPVFSSPSVSFGAPVATLTNATISLSQPGFLAPETPIFSNLPPSPQVEPERKGRPAFSVRPGDFSDATADQPGTKTDPSKVRWEQPAAVSAVRSEVDFKEKAEEMVRSELPGLVEDAVSRYCREHFKVIAKEVITAELRRLAEEKARFLVDQ